MIIVMLTHHDDDARIETIGHRLVVAIRAAQPELARQVGAGGWSSQSITDLLGQVINTTLTAEEMVFMAGLELRRGSRWCLLWGHQLMTQTGIFTDEFLAAVQAEACADEDHLHQLVEQLAQSGKVFKTPTAPAST